MSLTENEVSQWIRLTLRQHKMEHVKVSFKKMERSLGYFWAERNEIVLSHKSLESFSRFKEVCLHELCHALDWQERGTFKKNGRNDYHGKNFRKFCSTLGIPARRFIP